jgi:starch synthase
MAASRPDRFACRIGYDNALAHQIEGGCDFFLMPSAFEPCGLNQMYSMRYGTLPIVRATGGLDDSVENFNPAQRSGDGFKFWDLNAGALFDTIGWAVHTWYHDHDGIEVLRKNAMAKRFTWEDAAAKYEQLYLKAMRKKLGEERYKKVIETRSKRREKVREETREEYQLTIPNSN